ncbi:hypothetical protein FACS189499_03090 [Clostridia bacterium]|nr:hypothetical protein FACS189499_03090 [Clostridia bacterium]
MPKKIKIKNRILSAVMSAVLAVSAFPGVTAGAEEAQLLLPGFTVHTMYGVSVSVASLKPNTAASPAIPIPAESKIILHQPHGMDIVLTHIDNKNKYDQILKQWVGNGVVDVGEKFFCDSDQTRILDYIPFRSAGYWIDNVSGTAPNNGKDTAIILNPDNTYDGGYWRIEDDYRNLFDGVSFNIAIAGATGTSGGRTNAVNNNVTMPVAITGVPTSIPVGTKILLKGTVDVPNAVYKEIVWDFADYIPDTNNPPNYKPDTSGTGATIETSGLSQYITAMNATAVGKPLRLRARVKNYGGGNDYTQDFNIAVVGSVHTASFPVINAFAPLKPPDEKKTANAAKKDKVPTYKDIEDELFAVFRVYVVESPTYATPTSVTDLTLELPDGAKIPLSIPADGLVPRARLGAAGNGGGDITFSIGQYRIGNDGKSFVSVRVNPAAVYNNPIYSVSCGTGVWKITSTNNISGARFGLDFAYDGNGITGEGQNIVAFVLDPTTNYAAAGSTGNGSGNVGYAPPTSDTTTGSGNSQPSMYSVSLSTVNVNLKVGGNYTVGARVTPAAAYNSTYTWHTTDPRVATVSYDGNIYGVGAGTCSVYAVTKDAVRSENCTVRVTPKDPTSQDIADSYNPGDLGLFTPAEKNDGLVASSGKINTTRLMNTFYSDISDAGRGGNVTETLTNAKLIPLSTVKEIAALGKNSGNIKIYAYTTSGGSKIARLALDTKKLTESNLTGVNIYLTVDTASKTAESIRKSFLSTKKQTVGVIRYGQSGVFPKSIETAVKLTALDGIPNTLTTSAAKNLYFYSFDETKKTYRRIYPSNISVDSARYLHYTSDRAGTILIARKSF